MFNIFKRKDKEQREDAAVNANANTSANANSNAQTSSVGDQQATAAPAAAVSLTGDMGSQSNPQQTAQPNPQQTAGQPSAAQSAQPQPQPTQQAQPQSAKQGQPVPHSQIPKQTAGQTPQPPSTSQSPTQQATADTKQPMVNSIDMEEKAGPIEEHVVKPTASATTSNPKADASASAAKSSNATSNSQLNTNTAQDAAAGQSSGFPGSAGTDPQTDPNKPITPQSPSTPADAASKSTSPAGPSISLTAKRGSSSAPAGSGTSLNYAQKGDWQQKYDKQEGSEDKSVSSATPDQTSAANPGLDPARSKTQTAPASGQDKSTPAADLNKQAKKGDPSTTTPPPQAAASGSSNKAAINSDTAKASDADSNRPNQAAPEQDTPEENTPKQDKPAPSPSEVKPIEPTNKKLDTAPNPDSKSSTADVSEDEGKSSLSEMISPDDPNAKKILGADENEKLDKDKQLPKDMTKSSAAEANPSGAKAEAKTDDASTPQVPVDTGSQSEASIAEPGTDTAKSEARPNNNNPGASAGKQGVSADKSEVSTGEADGAAQSEKKPAGASSSAAEGKSVASETKPPSDQSQADKTNKTTQPDQSEQSAPPDQTNQSDQPAPSDQASQPEQSGQPDNPGKLDVNKLKDFTKEQLAQRPDQANMVTKGSKPDRSKEDPLAKLMNIVKGEGAEYRVKKVFVVSKYKISNEALKILVDVLKEQGTSEEQIIDFILQIDEMVENEELDESFFDTFK
jgi:hypothetical protein